MKKIKLFQDAGFKLVAASDMDPRNVLPGATATSAARTSEEDPSIGDIAKVSDEAASVVYIEGYASVFLNPDGSRLEDRDGESVSIALLDIANYKKNPILVYNHDWGDVAGQIVEIEKNEKGLYIKAEVHKFTGREQVFESVQKGILKTFSIGFVPKTFTYIEEDDVFEISSAELVEISLAPVPSNQDAIFIATSQKGLTVDRELVKEQNNMTCDELSGICTMSKQIKGKDMAEVTTKEVDEKAAEDAAKAAKEVEDKAAEAAKEAEEKAAKEAEDAANVAKEDPKKDLSVEDIAAAITQASDLAKEKETQKEAEEKATKEAEEKATEDAKVQRVKDSLDYIKEQKEIIEQTPAGDIDPDALEDFYELLSDTVELINSKVTEAIAS